MATKTIHRGLRDMKIALWNGENSWGTAYDIYGARSMTIEFVVESDQLEGDDVVLDRYSKIIAVNFSFENAAVDLEVLDMLSGGVLVSNSDYEDIMIGEDASIPYVGMAGRVVGSDATHDLHVLVPKAKMSGNLQYQAQYGQYVLPQCEFQGVNEGAVNGIARLRKFTALTDLDIPLATSAG
ncbi:MAG TPA: hypothetical protein PKD55_01040 [Bellilinea sp.]|nr:hypothetical protein [Bellilinea sp.]